MSVNIFYPENQDIAKRCTELSDDIVNMQTSLNGRFDDNAIVSDDLHKLVNEVMKTYGYKTYDELLKAVLATLPAEQYERIKKQLDEMQKLNNGLDITFQVCILITATAGVAGTTAKIVDLIKSGALTNALAKRVGQVSRFFRTGNTMITVEEKAAETLIEGAAEVSGEAAAESVTVGSRIARYCKIVGVIGVAVDVFLIALAAWEGHKQKEELIKDVHYLNVRRVLCRIYTREAEALVNFSSQLKAVLTLINLNQPDAMKGAIAALEASFVADVEKVYKTHGIVEAYESLGDSDDSRGSYLKEDLSLAAIKAEIYKEVDDPVDHPTAKSGTTVSTVVFTNGIVKAPTDGFAAGIPYKARHHASFA